MSTRKIGITIALAGALGLGGYVATGTARPESVERIDFGTVKTATVPTYDASVKPVSAARIKEFTIPMTHETIEIAPGVKYEGWTFGGTVPGPVIRVKQGDLVRIKLTNPSPMPHSIDFHSARIPMNQAFKTIMPGESLDFEFEARDAGVFMVHCGTPPVLMHIAQGMYLPIIVDPKDGYGTKADKEFVIVQSEFYAKDGLTHDAPKQADWEAMQEKKASYVVFNGRASQYAQHPLKVDEGDRVRLFVMNAGPSLRSDFHVVGAIFDRVYPDGNPKNVLESVQTYQVPAGGGAIFESVFEKGKSGEGMYAFVTHAFADANKGAVGMIQVGNPKVNGPMGH